MTVIINKIGIILSAIFLFVSNQGNNVYDITESLPKNYTKKGNVDYTIYIQKALDEHRDVIFPNFPVLINDKGLTLKSNSVIRFDKKSCIHLASSNSENYNIFKIHNVSNIKIYDANIKGDRNQHFGDRGEWGMGIGIRSSSNIKIYNPIIKDCWGDGIYIGRISKNKTGYIPSRNVSIIGGSLISNRRNGISITCGIGINVENMVISNTNGTLPSAGIDIEPNSNLEFIDNIYLNSIKTSNNGYGILIGLRKIVGASHKTTIKIIKHADNGSTIGLRVGGCLCKNIERNILGNIFIDNCTWLHNKKQSLKISSDQQSCPNIIIKNVSGNNVSKLRDELRKNNQIKNVLIN